MSLAGGHRRGYAWALSAGLNAALAAVSAKFVPSQFSELFSFNNLNPNKRNFPIQVEFVDRGITFYIVIWLVVDLRSIFLLGITSKNYGLLGNSEASCWKFPRYGLVILFNVIMWGCYVNSLKALSSLQATVTNFAANFLTSGLAGFFLFKEPLSSQWFVGAFFIILGVFVLSKSSSPRKLSSD